MLLSDAIKKPYKKTAQQTASPTSTASAPRSPPRPRVVEGLIAFISWRPVVPPAPPVTDAAERAKVAESVERALNDLTMSENARIKGNVVTSSYLPKEVAYDVDAESYRKMVIDEVYSLKSKLDKCLAPYMPSIKSIRVNDGKKSEIFIHVELN